MPRRCRPLLVLVPLLGWAVVRVQAAEPTNDTISTTRRDLESLKTDRNLPADSAKVALPTIDAPVGVTPAPLTPTGPLPPDAQLPPGPRQPRRSNSWLIDAMEGNSTPGSLNGGASKTTDPWQLLMLGEDSRAKDGKAGSDSRSRLGLSDVEKDGILGTRSGSQRGADAAADGKADPASLKDAAPNPLAGYMAGWMTSRDFNLLARPETGGAPGLSGGSPVSRVTAPAETFSPSSAFFSAAGGGPVEVGPARGEGPAGAPENPYLQALTLPAPSPAQPPALVFPSSPGPAPFPTVLPPMDRPTPPERGELSHPELQKRDDDAKYFPQLKRF